MNTSNKCLINPTCDIIYLVIIYTKKNNSEIITLTENYIFFILFHVKIKIIQFIFKAENNF